MVNAFSIVIEIWWMVNEILNWNLIDSIKHVIVYMKKLIRTCIFCSFFEKMKFKTTHLLTNGNLVRCGCKGKKRNQKRSSRPAQSAGLAMYVDVLSAVDKPHCCTSAAYRHSMHAMLYTTKISCNAVHGTYNGRIRQYVSPDILVSWLSLFGLGHGQRLKTVKLINKFGLKSRFIKVGKRWGCCHTIEAWPWQIHLGASTRQKKKKKRRCWYLLGWQLLSFGIFWEFPGFGMYHVQ